MHAIQPSIQHGGAMERPGNRPHPATAPATTTAPTGSAAVADTVTLSPGAKAFLEGEGPGKSGSSPAHLARAAIANNAEIAGMPFGKIVSGLIHGVDFSPTPPPVDESGDIPAGENAPLDGTEIVSVDPLAPATGDEPVPSAADDGADGDIPVVVAGDGTDAAGEVNLFPDVESIVDPDASLLEILDAALNDAGDENPDGLDGTDIAA